MSNKNSIHCPMRLKWWTKSRHYLKKLSWPKIPKELIRAIEATFLSSHQVTNKLHNYVLTFLKNWILRLSKFLLSMPDLHVNSKRKSSLSQVKLKLFSLRILPRLQSQYKAWMSWLTLASIKNLFSVKSPKSPQFNWGWLASLQPCKEQGEQGELVMAIALGFTKNRTNKKCLKTNNLRSINRL